MVARSLLGLLAALLAGGEPFSCWTGGFRKEHCCPAVFGPRGNPACFSQQHYTFDRCCRDLAPAPVALASVARGEEPWTAAELPADAWELEGCFVEPEPVPAYEAWRSRLQRRGCALVEVEQYSLARQADAAARQYTAAGTVGYSEGRTLLRVLGGVIAEVILAQRVEGRPVGVCHGTKAGDEVEILGFALSWKLGVSARVRGTDIYVHATAPPWLIQQDFSRVLVEEAGTADFVYSASLDHARNPSLTLGAWATQLKPTGLLVLAWSELHLPHTIDPVDVFGAYLYGLCAILPGANLRFLAALRVDMGDNAEFHTMDVLLAVRLDNPFSVLDLRQQLGLKNHTFVKHAVFDEQASMH